MADDPTSIDIVASHYALSVVVEGEERLVLSLRSDGMLLISAITDEKIDLVDLDKLTMDVPLTIQLREPSQRRRLGEDKVVARPPAEAREATVTTLPLPAREVLVPKSASMQLTPMEELLRDEIVSEVLDSWAEYPIQDTSYTAEESHRIAKTVLGDDNAQNVCQVAGVRAALTRGVYDATHEGAAALRRHILKVKYGETVA